MERISWNQRVVVVNIPLHTSHHQHACMRTSIFEFRVLAQLLGTKYAPAESLEPCQQPGRCARIEQCETEYRNATTICVGLRTQISRPRTTRVVLANDRAGDGQTC